MNLQEIQDAVDVWIKSTKTGYFPPLEILAQMTEELGEISREVKHIHGVKKKKTPDEGKENMTLEIGDLLFAIVCLANTHEISLDEAIRKTMEKFNIRDADRWGKKEE